MAKLVLKESVKNLEPLVTRYDYLHSKIIANLVTVSLSLSNSLSQTLSLSYSFKISFLSPSLSLSLFLAVSPSLTYMYFVVYALFLFKALLFNMFVYYTCYNWDYE